MMKHLPSGPLGDAQVSLQFHARHAFEIRGNHVNSDNPFLVRQIGGVHYGVSLY